jgi:hypothetical protein
MPLGGTFCYHKVLPRARLPRKLTETLDLSAIDHAIRNHGTVGGGGIKGHHIALPPPCVPPQALNIFDGAFLWTDRENDRTSLVAHPI